MEEIFKVPLPNPKKNFVNNANRKSNECENNNSKSDSDVLVNCKQTINAEIVKDSPPSINIPYIVPKWSKSPDENNDFSLKIVENSVVTDEIKNIHKKEFWCFGRHPNCDYQLSHLNTSRFHSVLQYHPGTKENNTDSVNEINDKITDKVSDEKHWEEGWYLFDLNSTYGTFLNKQKIVTKTYTRVQIGDLITFGGSISTFLLTNSTLEDDEILNFIKVYNKLSTPAEDQKKVSDGSLNANPYQVPSWSATPDPSDSFRFEILKNGVINEKVDDLQTRDYWFFGRHPMCQIILAHPHTSRFHAVLQYHPGKSASSEDENNSDDIQVSQIGNNFKKGWYLYDLNSTHGTYLNKHRIPPKTYVAVNVGHMLKFGGSTKTYILEGPTEEEDNTNTQMTITEFKKMKVIKMENKVIEDVEKNSSSNIEDEGISWGMGEDADAETDLTINPYASTNNEEIFLNDPKKTLRGFFEREGLELEYKLEELGAGSFSCRVVLPIDDINGSPIVAEVSLKGKKKECVIQCALEACKILDRQGVLRQATHEPLRRRANYSDSDDDDDFLDRTGDVERRRERKTLISQNKTLTFEELVDKEKELLQKQNEIELEIKSCELAHHSSKKDDDDDLDKYISTLSNEKPIEKFTIRKLRMESKRIKEETTRVQKLIKIATPVELPPINFEHNNDPKNETNKKLCLPLFGKRKKLNKNFGVTKTENEFQVPEIQSDDDNEESSNIENAHISPAKTNTMQTTNLKKETDSVHKINSFIQPTIGTKYENEGRHIEKSESEPNKIVGPTLIDYKEQITIENTEDSNINKLVTKRNIEDIIDESTTSKKKRKNRNKGRERVREQVDMNDHEEITDVNKYSQWVPPKDQQGDGMTSLNDKFGY